MRFLISRFFTFIPDSPLVSHRPICLLQSGHSPGLSEVMHAMGHLYTNFCFFSPVGKVTVTLFCNIMPHMGHDLGAVVVSHSCGQMHVSFSPETSTGISFFSRCIPHFGQSPSVFEVWHSIGHTYTVC